jgi:hypothetical protein
LTEGVADPSGHAVVLLPIAPPTTDPMMPQMRSGAPGVLSMSPGCATFGVSLAAVGALIPPQNRVRLVRRTYENLAADWPNAAEEEQPVAQQRNTKPKYVAWWPAAG